MGCIFLNHFTGQVFVTKYGAIFIKELGTMDPMEFGLLERGLDMLGPIILMATVDHFGRRPIFLSAAVPYALCLFVIAALGMANGAQYQTGVIVCYIVAAISHIISFHSM
jgi:MFS transporter, SP family, sugar:H+ symporter